MKKLSIVAKDYQTEEHVIGFYDARDRVKFWGKRMVPSGAQRAPPEPTSSTDSSSEALLERHGRARKVTMHILWFLMFGLVVGTLARFIVPGREPGGWVISMLIGIGGAIVGGYFGRVVGLYREGQPAGFIMSLVAAISMVVVYKALIGRRDRTA